MKLCLDEHYSSAIAVELRERAHDVCSVKERPDLLCLNDVELFGRLVAERRALLTENVGDFAPLAQQAAQMGGNHPGLIFSLDRSMPRSKNTIGLFVERLEVVLRAFPGEDSFADQVEWLRPG